MKFTYRHTLAACYTGYITQAIVNNLSPLLFLTFNSIFGISLEKIALLISANFVIQILTDLCSTKIVDRFGVRASITAAHVFAAAGLAGMGIFPYLLPDPFAGLVLSAALCAVGGGLTEVLISPIVDSLPGDAKASAMSLLHSFYCWGQVSVVLLSTLFFNIAGIENWRILAALWAIVPAANIFLFVKVPLCPFVDDDAEEIPLKTLFSSGAFLLFCILMVSAGASELAASQWASLFAESGLGVSKTVGDLLGPCMFAALMGLARLCYGIFGKKIRLAPVIAASSVLCIISYILMVFSPLSWLSLAGCGLCGLSVGIMWPGIFSIASEKYPSGGTSMFAVLALAGDIGCSSGPGLVGIFVNASESGAGWIAGLFPGIEASLAGLRTGLLFAAVFPLIMLTGILCCSVTKKPEDK
ncbi:MAG: MFS transporter [Oscillospiraceae bacterium]|nr:MFS transporter [Oscillospiraceae bacterium]